MSKLSSIDKDKNESYVFSSTFKRKPRISTMKINDIERFDLDFNINLGQLIDLDQTFFYLKFIQLVFFRWFINEIHNWSKRRPHIRHEMHLFLSPGFDHWNSTCGIEFIIKATRFLHVFSSHFFLCNERISSEFQRWISERIRFENDDDDNDACWFIDELLKKLWFS